MIVLRFLLDLVVFFALSTIVQWIFPSIRRNLSEEVVRWLPIFSAVLMIFFLIARGHDWWTIFFIALTVGLTQGPRDRVSSTKRRVI